MFSPCPTLASTYHHHCPTGAIPGWSHHRYPVPVSPLNEAWALAVTQVHENLLKAQALQLTLAQGHLDVIGPTLQPTLQEREIWNRQRRWDWKPVTIIQSPPHLQGQLVGLAITRGALRLAFVCSCYGLSIRGTETQDWTLSITGWIQVANHQPLITLHVDVYKTKYYFGAIHPPALNTLNPYKTKQNNTTTTLITTYFHPFYIKEIVLTSYSCF